LLMVRSPMPVSSNVEIEAAGECLKLLPDRAVLWEAARTLFIADPHFGKAQTFRSAGIAAPERSHAADLDTLGRLIASTGAERLIVLGDLLHARSGVREAVVRSLMDWRGAHRELQITLVRGNHDRSAGDPPDELLIACVDPEEALGPFALLHEPRDHPESGIGYGLAGHVHPGVRLQTGPNARSSHGARFPAFIFGERQAIIPAFGRFTGLGMVRPNTADRVAIIADGEVIMVGVR